MRKNKCILFSVEGIDGCGKTSTINYLQKELSKLSVGDYKPKIATVSFFGQTPEAMEFKQEVISGKLDEREIADGLLKHSSYLLRHTVRELSETCDVILMDRGRASFFAYQIEGFGLKDYEAKLDEQMHLDKRSNMTPQYLYIKPEFDKIYSNIAKRGEKDHIESQGDRFMRAVYDGYESFFKYKFNKTDTKLSIIDVQKTEEIYGTGLDVLLSRALIVFMKNHGPQLFKNVKERNQ